MQFKSTDCKFFGHRLIPDGIKVDPKKIEAIIQMDPPQNVANLVFQWNDQLWKEVQPSLIQTFRATQETIVINLTFICLINYILFDCNKVGRKLRWSLKEFDLT